MSPQTQFLGYPLFNLFTQAAFAGYPSFIIEGYHVKLPRQKRTERCKTDNNNYLI